MTAKKRTPKTVRTDRRFGILSYTGSMFDPVAPGTMLDRTEAWNDLHEVDSFYGQNGIRHLAPAGFDKFFHSTAEKWLSEPLTMRRAKRVNEILAACKAAFDDLEHYKQVRRELNSINKRNQDLLNEIDEKNMKELNEGKMLFCPSTEAESTINSKRYDDIDDDIPF